MWRVGKDRKSGIKRRLGKKGGQDLVWYGCIGNNTNVLGVEAKIVVKVIWGSNENTLLNLPRNRCEICRFFLYRHRDRKQSNCTTRGPTKIPGPGYHVYQCTINGEL